MEKGKVWRILGVIIGALLLFCLGACSRKTLEGHPEYSYVADSTYVHLITVGENGESPNTGDYVTVSLNYATFDDSLFFEGVRRFQLEPSQYPGSINQCLAMLSPGDSASFYLNARRFFKETLSAKMPSFLDSTGLMRVDVKMISMEDSAQYAESKNAFLHWLEGFEEYEQLVLKRYLKKEGITGPAVDSLFYVPVTPGHGPHPKDGDTITIEFEGRFFDGKYFDSTYRRGEPFVFVLGQRWQVVEGLERAVRLMRAGEKAIFILPSIMAFGKNGSSTGIVPPYTPVIFEIDMVELKPGELRGEG